LLRRHRLICLFGAAVFTLVLPLCPATAQAPNAPRVSPDSRGYQTWMANQHYNRSGPLIAVPPAAPQATRRAVAASLVTTIAGSPESGLAYLALEKAKREAAARPASVPPQRIILRPGQSVTIRVVTPAKAPTPPSAPPKTK
jgi:hypothetical protein